VITEIFVFKALNINLIEDYFYGQGIITVKVKQQEKINIYEEETKSDDVDMVDLTKNEIKLVDQPRIIFDEKLIISRNAHQCSLNRI
jgi:hypothetical protein